jgi:FkbM family methyltransferase
MSGFKHRLRELLKRILYRQSIGVAQAGQDQWVAGEAFDERQGGYFVDIGAYDGVKVSNTFILEKRLGWRGLCIEANPRAFAALERNRSSTCLNVCLDQVEGEVEFALRGELGGIAGLSDIPSPVDEGVIRLPTRRLESVLREQGAPAVIDYLSIDVEGAEERVLADFDFSAFRFNTLTIERPSDRLREVLRANRYRLVKEIPWLDCFYVHEDFVDTYRDNLFSYFRKRYLRVRWR